jgi:hypothetical protein
VAANEDGVRGLFEDIYSNDPWRINPSIFQDNHEAVMDAVRRVCQACKVGAGPMHNLQIAPLINIRVKKSLIAELKKGSIPPSSPVTGEGTWETVFGKPEGTAGWTWQDLTAGIAHTSAWEYQLSAMMAEAVERRSVRYPSIAVRISVIGDANSDIYRVGLRRVAEFEDDFEFVYVLSRIRLPFEASQDDRQTMLYHLFHLAWYFRRRFVEQHMRKMEELAYQQDTDQHRARGYAGTAEWDEAVRSLSVDLKVLEADAQVRGLERRMQVRRALPADKQELVEHMFNDFQPLLDQLNAAIINPTPLPREICEILTKMDPINKWFYENSLKALCEFGNP